MSEALITLAGDVPLYPKAQGYGALVDDQWVRLAPNAAQGVRYYTKDSLAERFDQRGSIFENVLDIGYAFARSDVSGGEGLDWDPRLTSSIEEAQAIDKLRFWDSTNIDVAKSAPGEPYTFSLSRDMAIWKTYADLVDVATSDLYIYVAHGNTVDRWLSWDSPGPDFTDNTLSDINMIAASPDGDVAAVLLDGTVEMFTIPSDAFAPVVDPVKGPLINVIATWHVKGRFVALVDNLDGTHSLLEYDNNSIGEPFDTFRGTCYSLVSSGPAIVGAIEDGTLRSYVPEQANQNDPDSVNLVIRGRTEMPEGEIPYLLGSNAGVLLVLAQSNGAGDDNDARLYQAEVLDARFDYTVGQLQLRREWVDSHETIDPKQNMATTRNEIWFTVQETATHDSTWRFDLVTLGLSRHRTMEFTGTHSIVIFNDDGANIFGTSIWKTEDNYIDQGWLISPNITFGLNTDIAWMETVTVVSNIVSGGKQVELWYSTNSAAITDPDHDSWAIASRISSPTQDEVTALLTKVKSKQLALMVRLYSSEATTKTPKVTRFAVRGIPVHRDWILELPVNVSDLISAPGRRPIVVHTFGDKIHEAMISKVGDNINIEVLDPPFKFRGIIDNIVEPTEYITDRGSVSVRLVLQCRGTRIVDGSTSIGDAGLGIGLLGVTRLGVGQTPRT